MKKHLFRFLASLGVIFILCVFVGVGFSLYKGVQWGIDFSTNNTLGEHLERLSPSATGTTNSTGSMFHNSFSSLMGFFEKQTAVKGIGKTGAMSLAVCVFLIAAIIIKEILLFIQRELGGINLLLAIPKALWSLLIFLIGLPFRLLGTLIRKALHIKAQFPTKKSKLELLFSTYWSFIKRYIRQESVWNLFRAHGFFIRYFFSINSIPTSGKELALFSVPFEHKHMAKRLNQIISQAAGKDIYISDIYLGDQVVTFSLAENGMFGDQMKALLYKCADEMKRALPGYEKDSSSFGEITIETYKEHTAVRMAHKDIWKIIEPNLDTLDVPKGKILLGFYPQIQGKQIEEKNYYIEASNLLHSFVVGATQHGKDVFMKNFIFSLLKHISTGYPYEVHFLDVKESDGQYLEGLKSYGVFRYADKSQYIQALSGLNERMEARQRQFGFHSNLKDYRKAFPETKMKEVFIIVNELMDLVVSADKKDTESLIALFTSILSKGAGAGFRLILMAQTMRKDLDPKYAKIFSNISTRFSVKVTNMEEAEISGRGLPREEFVRLYSLIKYNALHIDESKIQQEFRAYNITQLSLQSWIEKTFQTEKLFEDAQINDYYLYAKQTGKISMKEAMGSPFSLSRSQWDFFISHLEEQEKITKEKGKPIAFKNTTK